MCSNPHANGRTRRLSSVVHRRCSYLRIRCSNQFISLSTITNPRGSFSGRLCTVGSVATHPSPPTDNRKRTTEDRTHALPVSHATPLYHSKTVTIAAFFLFGLVIGSFLNVCITRIPEGASIVSPRSRCPQCSSPIQPYDNIPVISWLALAGKCRNCKAPISPMYPAIELLTGLLFVACYLCFGLTVPALKWAFFSCLVLVLVMTDFRDRILPDVVNWFGVGLGLV